MANGINRVLFLGSKQLGLRVLRELRSIAPEALCAALTIDDRDDSRSVFSDFGKFASANQIPLHVAASRKNSEEIIRNIKPDLCLVVGWYWMLSPETLNSVPHGFLGIHNSLLPKYRGGAPVVWTLINGESEAGFSLFSFTPGMDDGPVWASGSVAIGPDDYVGTVLVKLEELTIRILRENFSKILDGSCVPQPQPHELATYCALRIPEDGNIDWNWPARRVHNFIRAQSQPYPGAFTWYQDQALTIWKARVDECPYFGTPGQVAQIGKQGVHVICGDERALILEQVAYNGKSCAAQELLKSVRARFRSAPAVIPSAGAMDKA